MMAGSRQQRAGLLVGGEVDDDVECDGADTLRIIWHYHYQINVCRDMYQLLCRIPISISKISPDPSQSALKSRVYFREYDQL